MMGGRVIEAATGLLKKAAHLMLFDLVQPRIGAAKRTRSPRLTGFVVLQFTLAIGALASLVLI